MKNKLNIQDLPLASNSDSRSIIDGFLFGSSTIKELAEDQLIDLFISSSLQSDGAESFQQIKDLVDRENSPVRGTIFNTSSR